eukprot:3016192-Pleurochrysis_carterae.AAC.1
MRWCASSPNTAAAPTCMLCCNTSAPLEPAPSRSKSIGPPCEPKLACSYLESDAAPLESRARAGPPAAASAISAASAATSLVSSSSALAAAAAASATSAFAQTATPP